MVREEFLELQSRQNLMGSRIIRDVAACLQTGVRAGGIKRILCLERIKTVAEDLMEAMTENSRGVISAKGDSGLFTAYTSGGEARSLSLVSLNLKLTPSLKDALKDNQTVKVGTRANLYDSALVLSLRAVALCESLCTEIVNISLEQNDGKCMSGFSATALEFFRHTVADYGAVASALGRGEKSELITRSDAVAKMTAYLSDSVDYGDIKLREWIKNTSEQKLILERLSSAASGGVLKSTLPPLIFDLCYRYCLELR